MDYPRSAPLQGPPSQPAGITPAAVPSTSPAVEHEFVGPNGSVDCPSGYACAGVPYSTGALVFKFYTYGSYALSYWHGTGFVANVQTGGAATRLYDGNGGAAGCIPAGVGQNGINWDPIWTIALTASHC
ncbi:hypothetical protein [Actinoallomurus soli]|uniref:hypothetical protein n=1 Tax=Actinoallomurus soli TaxID=2952535 RepID=UPI002092016D|nr:hypothetical protein [Actinoallomurus soli]MCO5972444.1 hypothetical protein [Actinoallomurus soli]